MNKVSSSIIIGIFVSASIIVISFAWVMFTLETRNLPDVVQKAESKTIRSTIERHPGIAEHQFTIILHPNDVIYDGTITWVSSQPVLPAVLHGPLDRTQTNGQFAASIDEGKTKHAMTVASPQLLNGTYSFVGNGLIMHNVENNPFWISYSISYKEINY